MKPQRLPRPRLPSAGEKGCAGALGEAHGSLHHGSYHESPSQPSAPQVDHDDERDQRVEVRPDLAVVEVFKRRRDVVAERWETEEAQHCGRTERALETVERIRAKVAEGAWEEAEKEHLERRRTYRAKGFRGVARRFVDHLGEDFAQRAAVLGFFGFPT